MTNLFFLNPWWLVGTLLSLLALYYLGKTNSSKSNWWSLMDNHIGETLITPSGSSKWLTPLNLLLLLVALSCVALAGPSTQKQVPDELKDKASVIVLLANSDSMYAGDITPNRNRVAKSKITQLRSALPGSQFGLIAFSHSAHQVAPLTDDPKFLELYLSPLEPKLMPTRQFNDSGIQHGLKIAKRMMKNAKYPINLLIITDQLTDQESLDIIDFQQSQAIGVEVLAVGTEAGGALRFNEQTAGNNAPNTTMALAPFQQLKQQGIAMLGVTQSADDITYLANQIKAVVQQKNNENPNFDWHNAGYWLSILLLPVCLMLFRKNTWTFNLIPFMFVGLMTTAPNAQAINWQSLWYSPDQLGQIALEQGDYAGAAKHFADPYRKGWALYQLGDFKGAQAQFSQVHTSQGYFYLANSLAMQAQYKQALNFYGEALALNPNLVQAQQNANQVKTLIAQANKVSQNQRLTKDDGQILLQVGGTGNVKKKQHIHLDPLKYSEEELDVWLNKVKSSPDKLLKTKFDLQSQEKMIDAL